MPIWNACRSRRVPREEFWEGRQREGAISAPLVAPNMAR